MNDKIVGAIFCFISAFLISAKYISAALFMSNVASWDATLFASGLEYVGSTLSLASIVALVVGIAFIGLGFYQKKKK